MDSSTFLQIFVNAPAVPVHTVLDDLGWRTGDDHVRFVKPPCHDTAPAHNAVVGYTHVLAYLYILAYPHMAPYLYAMGIIYGISVKVGYRMRVGAPYIHTPTELAVVTDTDARAIFLQTKRHAINDNPVAYRYTTAACRTRYAWPKTGQLAYYQLQSGHS